MENQNLCTSNGTDAETDMLFSSVKYYLSGVVSENVGLIITFYNLFLCLLKN